MGHIINPDFRYEDLGTELLVCDPRSGTVVRLVNGEAEALRNVIAAPDHRATNVSLRHSAVRDDATLDRLTEAGIVLADGNGSDLTRRRVLQLSAAGAAAAGLAVVALPNAAAASSPPPSSTTTSTTAAPVAPVGPISFTVFAGAGSTGTDVSVNWNAGANDPFKWKVIGSGTSGISGIDTSSEYDSGGDRVIGTRTSQGEAVSIEVESLTVPPATRTFFSPAS